MSCLNLRLPPPKRAWKSFTSKLQSKLHKLHMSKSRAVEKPRYRLNSTTSTKAIRPPIFSEKRDRSRRRLRVRPSRTLPFKQRNSRFQFYKKTAPIYIDNLFPEPVTELVAKFPTSAKNVKLLNHREKSFMPGTSMDNEKGAEIAGVADDLWESLAFSSSQLQGIDERAEQFILSFRADMELQEIIARGLQRTL